MKIAIYLVILALIATTYYLIYNAGKQSIIHKLTTDRIEVIKDGKKVDAGVFAADDDSLICLLTKCNNN